MGIQQLYAPKLEDIMELMDSKGHSIFSGDGKYDLNIVGVRTSDPAPNTFNDWITVFYVLQGRWVFFAFPATTDPGLFYLENPLNIEGTAILVPGQYKGAFKIGIHKGYPALKQAAPLKVYRDSNRDAVLDWHGEYGEGIYGIDLHRASRDHASLRVDKWSAGCQVIQDPIHFSFLMQLCYKSAVFWGEYFTYTLLEV